MISSRRSFFLGASAFLAAPSIVRVASLMPVSVLDMGMTATPVPYTAPVPVGIEAQIAQVMARTDIDVGQKQAMIFDLLLPCHSMPLQRHNRRDASRNA